MIKKSKYNSQRYKDMRDLMNKINSLAEGEDIIITTEDAAHILDMFKRECKVKETESYIR